MNFTELKNCVREKSGMNFSEASSELEMIIYSLNREEVLPLIYKIGIIPENIENDSTEEKLYSKVSDIIFAKAKFQFHEAIGN